MRVNVRLCCSPVARREMRVPCLLQPPPCIAVALAALCCGLAAQIDRLMPTLTTRETLNFAETCAGPSRHLDEAMRRMMAWEAAHPEEATRTELDDEVTGSMTGTAQGNHQRAGMLSITASPDSMCCCCVHCCCCCCT